MNLRTRAAFWSARTPVPLYTAIYPECHQAFRKLKAFREDAFPFLVEHLLLKAAGTRPGFGWWVFCFCCEAGCG